MKAQQTKPLTQGDPTRSIVVRRFGRRLSTLDSRLGRTANSKLCPPFGSRPGFTLVELLVVMTIIAILMAISGTMIANYLTRARETATAATIRKIHGMIQQRKEALDKAVDSTQFRNEVKRIIDSLVNSDVGLKSVSRDVLEILLKKQVFRESFPQRFPELYGFDGAPGVKGKDDDGNSIVDFDNSGYPDLAELGYPGSDDPPVVTGFREASPNMANHIAETESSELLYLALTSGGVFGTPPIDTDEFSTSEVTDADHDGLNEFVDRWGRPLRFYRWPTRLFKPNGNNIDVGPDGAPGVLNVDDDNDGTTDNPTEIRWPGSDDMFAATLLIKGLPSRPIGRERDPINEDPDDPLDRLPFEIDRLLRATNGSLDLGNWLNESNWHTLMTYHAPLIVSPGADGQLGLYEPYQLNKANNIFGTLAQPLSTTNIDALTDDITNRNQRAGGK